MTIIVVSLYVNMLTLACRETGLNCDYVIRGETEEDLLKNGAEHGTQIHDMDADDICR
jgi:predicted small metal-binding protein